VGCAGCGGVGRGGGGGGWGRVGWGGDIRIPSDGILNSDKSTRCVIRSLKGRWPWLGEKRNYSINQFANQSVEFICSAQLS
jgi:hypothetical protein